jgi:hypothetical protein
MEENSPKLHVNGEISSGSFDLRSFPAYGIRAALRTTGVRHLPNLDMLPYTFHGQRRLVFGQPSSRFMRACPNSPLIRS